MRIRLTTNHAKAVAKIQINWQLAIENRYFFSFFIIKVWRVVVMGLLWWVREVSAQLLIAFMAASCALYGVRCRGVKAS